MLKKLKNDSFSIIVPKKLMTSSKTMILFFFCNQLIPNMLICATAQIGQVLQKISSVVHHPSEAAIGGILRKKVFLKISKISQEDTCASLFFNKVAGLQLY